MQQDLDMIIQIFRNGKSAQIHRKRIVKKKHITFVGFVRRVLFVPFHIHVKNSLTCEYKDNKEFKPAAFQVHSSSSLLEQIVNLLLELCLLPIFQIIFLHVHIHMIHKVPCDQNIFIKMLKVRRIARVAFLVVQLSQKMPVVPKKQCLSW